MSDHDVAVSEIGAGSATFTVDGDTVTLRAGETRQVGPSLIHLTSVEDDVAKFSVDFSGLFVNRSDLENESGDEVATYESYTRVADDQGVVTVEVPVEWDDLDGREDPEYGPSIHAAPNLERFRQTWDVPGIMVDVSSRFGPDDISAIMNQGPSGQCTSEGREPYQDPLYAGEIERWTGCGGTDTVMMVAAVAPDDGGFLVRIFGQAVDDRDLDALDRALATLHISRFGAAESGPTATDEDWLEEISALRNDIDDAIDDAIVKTDSELTSAALTEIATAMRACSHEVASIGPPSARLQQVHARRRGVDVVRAAGIEILADPFGRQSGNNGVMVQPDLGDSSHERSYCSHSRGQPRSSRPHSARRASHRRLLRTRARHAPRNFR